MSVAVLWWRHDTPREVFTAVLYIHTRVRLSYFWRQGWRQMRRGGIAGTTYNLRLWPHKCQSLHKVRESSDDVGQAIDRMTW